MPSTRNLPVSSGLGVDIYPTQYLVRHRHSPLLVVVSMSRLLVFVLIFCVSHVYAIKSENKTVQDVFDHFNPIVSELALQARNLSRYYRHETSTQIKQSLENYPQDLQQKSADRGTLLQSEIKQLKSETKSVDNYNEIYQKCRPQINKELDALNLQNEEQSKECQKYLKQIELFLNNTELPDELHNLVMETDKIAVQCEKYEKIGQKMFAKINIFSYISTVGQRYVDYAIFNN
ncbi:hypothetical protein CBL_11061 [Carabus blaptoides fortunei]